MWAWAVEHNQLLWRIGILTVLAGALMNWLARRMESRRAKRDEEAEAASVNQADDQETKREEAEGAALMDTLGDWLSESMAAKKVAREKEAETATEEHGGI